MKKNNKSIIALIFLIAGIANGANQLKNCFQGIGGCFVGFGQALQNYGGTAKEATRRVDNFTQVMPEGIDKSTQVMPEGIDKSTQVMLEGIDKSTQVMPEGIDKSTQVMPEDIESIQDYLEPQAPVSYCCTFSSMAGNNELVPFTTLPDASKILDEARRIANSTSSGNPSVFKVLCGAIEINSSTTVADLEGMFEGNEGTMECNFTIVKMDYTQKQKEFLTRHADLVQKFTAHKLLLETMIKEIRELGYVQSDQVMVQDFEHRSMINLNELYNQVLHRKLILDGALKLDFGCWNVERLPQELIVGYNIGLVQDNLPKYRILVEKTNEILELVPESYRERLKNLYLFIPTLSIMLLQEDFESIKILHEDIFSIISESDAGQFLLELTNTNINSSFDLETFLLEWIDKITLTEEERSEEWRQIECKKRHYMKRVQWKATPSGHVMTQEMRENLSLFMEDLRERFGKLPQIKLYGRKGKVHG